MDVDGTLLTGHKIKITNSILDWIHNAKNNFSIYLVSNNPSQKRIQTVGEILELDYIFRARKPKTSTLNKLIQKIPHPSNEIAIVGDRVLTDVLVGNRLGMYTILVEPVGYNGEKCKRNIIQKIDYKIASLLIGENL